MTHVEFIAIGNRDGIPLFQHECARNGVAYVSATPSGPRDSYKVPMCGCWPLSAAMEVLVAGS